jgi:hypothetical protein
MNSDYDQLAVLGRTLAYTGELARQDKKVMDQAETIIRLSTENEKLREALQQFIGFTERHDELEGERDFISQTALEALAGILGDWQNDDTVTDEIECCGITQRDLRRVSAAFHAIAGTDAPPDIMLSSETRQHRKQQRLTGMIEATEAGKAVSGYPKQVRVTETVAYHDVIIRTDEVMDTVPPPFSIDENNTQDVWVKVGRVRKQLPAGTWERTDGITDANLTFGTEL